MSFLDIRVTTFGWETVLWHGGKRLAEEYRIIGDGKTRKNEYSFMETDGLPEDLINLIDEVQESFYFISEELKKIDDGKTARFKDKNGIRMYKFRSPSEERRAEIKGIHRDEA